MSSSGQAQAQVSFKPQFLVPPEKRPGLEDVGETNASRDPAVLRTEERLAGARRLTQRPSLRSGQGLQ